MSIGKDIADRLLNGETILRNKESGNSMLPILKSKQPVDISPIEDYELLKVNDIVFCKVKGNYYTHKIKAIKNQKGKLMFQIANNKGRVNGWVEGSKIYGIVSKIYEK